MKGSDCVAWSCGTLLSTPPSVGGVDSKVPQLHSTLFDRALLLLNFTLTYTSFSGTVDYVISGSGAKHTTTKGILSEKNIKKKKATAKFWNPDYGFAGIELEGNTVKVMYINRDGKELYSFSKTNPRSSKDVIG